MTSDSDKWLTADEVCTLMGISYASLRGRLRYKPIEVKYVNGECRPQGGRTKELRLSVASLLAHHWITEADLACLTEPLDTPGNQLYASKIVRKRRAEYEPAERDFLAKACGAKWMSLKKCDLIALLAKRVGKSPSWLQRDHTGEDGRTKKPDVFDQITDPQRRRIEYYFLQARLFSNFRKDCKQDDLLPQRSDSTWRRIWNELTRTHADEKVYHQKGPVALRQSTQPSLRDRTRLQLMELCSTDYWRVDVITEWPDGTFITPHLCVIREERTMKIVGAALTKYPNSLGVKTALFSTFANVGVMGTLYIDNGMEFTALRIIGPKSRKEWTYDHWKETLANDVEEDVRRFNALGFLDGMRVKVHRATVKNPRAKGVERSFGIGGLSDLAEQLYGWTGRQYTQRPEKIADALKAAKKGEEFVDKVTGQILRFMRYDELCEALQKMITTINGTPSKGFGMDGKSPDQKWLDLSATHKVSKPPLAKIAFAFLEGKEVTVRQTGQIEFKDDIFYTAPMNELRPYRKKRVHIRYNPVSDGTWLGNGETPHLAWIPRTLYVFDMKGEFITEAYIQERHKAIDASDAEMAQDRQRKREIIQGVPKNVQEIIAEGSPIPLVDVKNAPKELVYAETKKKQLKADDERQKQITYWLDRKKSFRGNNEVQVMINMRLQSLGYDIDVEDGCE